MGVEDETAALVAVGEFDGLAPDAAESLLRPCCASSEWAHRIIAVRPYRSLDSLLAGSDAIVAGLGWAGVLDALSAHPRIGDRVAGSDREAAWSRGEQAGARSVDDEVATALVEGNRAYEARFGHVFLICATGRTATQMLDALRTRLDNPAVVEQGIVRAELAAIVALRLRRTFR